MEEPLLTGQKVQVRLSARSQDAPTLIVWMQLIQFMHKPPTASKPFSPKSNEVSFFTLPQEEYKNHSQTSAQLQARSRSGFAVGSEGGFFFSGTADQQRDRIATGVCKVTNARGYLRFPDSE